MKVLSIKQPWASLIVHGVKDIENRTWKTKFRGRVFIHASATPKLLDNDSLFTAPQLEVIFSRMSKDKVAAQWFKEKFTTSAIIGEVDITDCIVNHPSIWAEKSDPELWDELGNQIYDRPIYNWVLANPILYDEPILNVKGKLSFWEFTKPENFK